MIIASFDYTYILVLSVCLTIIGIVLPFLCVIQVFTFDHRSTVVILIEY